LKKKIFFLSRPFGILFYFGPEVVILKINVPLRLFRFT